MAAMPEETRQKISASAKRSWQSPAVRARRVKAIHRMMTPTMRAKISRTMRITWARRREAKAVEAATATRRPA